MTPLEVQSRIGPDGVLLLSIPAGKENANREVRVTVEPVEGKPMTDRMSQSEWEQFIRATAGSITDPTFVRHDQGKLEDREELFP